MYYHFVNCGKNNIGKPISEKIFDNILHNLYFFRNDRCTRNILSSVVKTNQIASHYLGNDAQLI
jgi:hypothetical protein